MNAVVKDEFRPTLAELLRPLPRWVRWGVVAALAVLLAVGVWLASGGARESETHVVVREPIAFNLAYGPRLDRVDDRDEALLTLEQRRDGDVAQSFIVEPLELPSYRGTPAGAMPLYAAGYTRELEQTYPGFEFVREGRTRINENPGYEVLFRFRRDGHLRFGRHILLVPGLDEDENFVLDAVREGVVLELETAWSKATPNALSTGNVGALKKPLRSFRFGTERSGGTES
ncbi:MAG: hypothetical protein JHC95_11635 [Solirubrobacteraceae bacterium]|nr:hypothetical protein [Solirubrobacteraceae bacterium]